VSLLEGVTESGVPYLLIGFIVVGLALLGVALELWSRASNRRAAKVRAENDAGAAAFARRYGTAPAEQPHAAGPVIVSAPPAAAAPSMPVVEIPAPADPAAP
jgi:hypothetical protein